MSGGVGPVLAVGVCRGKGPAGFPHDAKGLSAVCDCGIS